MTRPRRHVDHGRGLVHRPKANLRPVGRPRHRPDATQVDALELLQQRPVVASATDAVMSCDPRQTFDQSGDHATDKMVPEWTPSILRAATKSQISRKYFAHSAAKI